jgi:hypothetical protein
MIVKSKTRRPLANPNMVAIADRLNSTVRSPVHPWFSHLPAPPELARTITLPARPTYIPPTKTTLFKSSDSVSAYYKLEAVAPPTPAVNGGFEIEFINPLPDELDSALTITFVCSRYSFCATLFSNIQSHRIDITNTYRSIQLLNPIENVDSTDPIQKAHAFLSIIRSLNISISEPLSVKSLEELQTHAEQIFFTSHEEDIVFSIPNDIVPPNTIVFKSTAVDHATAGGSFLEVKYHVHWGIAIRAGSYLPIIVQANGEVDALYHCVANNHFGSIRSLVYSDVPIEFICYSIRPHECPEIRIG